MVDKVDFLARRGGAVAKRLTRLIPMLACAATASAGGAQSLATPVGSPADWFGADEYPAEAIRRSEQGRVVAWVTVDPAGKPIGCDVKESSGSAALDRKTCDIVLRKAFYEPSRDGKDRPIQAKVLLAVRWDLPGSTPISGTIDVAARGFRANGTDLTITTTVAPDGTIASCTEVPPAEPGHDNCASSPVGKKVMPALTRGGRPIGARVVQRLTIETIYDP